MTSAADDDPPAEETPSISRLRVERLRLPDGRALALYSAADPPP